MSRISYTNKNISHLVGKKFTSTWGNTIIEIQPNPRTGRIEYKIGPTYLPNVNQVGWYLKGKIDCPQIDSRFRPKMMLDIESNKTLYDLRRESSKEVKNSFNRTVVYNNTPVKNENKQFCHSCSHLSLEQKECVKHLLQGFKYCNKVSQETLYNSIKSFSNFTFNERKEIVKRMFEDKLIYKRDGYYYCNW